MTQNQVIVEPWKQKKYEPDLKVICSGDVIQNNFQGHNVTCGGDGDDGKELPHFRLTHRSKNSETGNVRVGIHKTS